MIELQLTLMRSINLSIHLQKKSHISHCITVVLVLVVVDTWTYHLGHITIDRGVANLYHTKTSYFCMPVQTQHLPTNVFGSLQYSFRPTRI